MLVRLLFAAVSLSLLAGRATFAAAPLDFNRDVRTILSDNCFQCHGPDEKKREAGLRLDAREFATKPAESGDIAIVPQDLTKSAAIRRILSTDPDTVMPPPKSGKKLTPAQIETLQRWVTEGANYQGHWSFQPIKRPAVPEVTTGQAELRTWAQNPVDQFILAKLQAADLTPQPVADRETLIRRASLDLIGLPPTLAEIDAFVNDKSPNAFEKVVDRLLASPHYGERMALPWLDLARYADSNGFQTDSSRQMWPWRDWVIQAFNDNRPFDQFTIEQLAGDLLPNATRDQIVATGFNRNHRINGEGGRIVEEWFAENVIDRVETTGLTWLGLTLNCCRCHEHKYDPISQKEFYQLFAYFNSIEESGVIDNEGNVNRNRSGGNQRPTIRVVTKDDEAALAKLEAAVSAAQAEVNAAEKQLPELIAAWEPQLRTQLAANASPWQPLAPTAVKSQKGAMLKKMDDGSYLATDKNPENDVYQVVAPLDGGTLSGLLLEVFPDPSLPNQSLGRASNGNFVLTSLEAEIAGPQDAKPTKVVFTKAEADFEQDGWSVKSMLNDGKKKAAGNKGWAINGNDPDKRLPRKAMFVATKTVPVPAGAKLTVYLRHDSQYKDHNVGRFRLSTSGVGPETLTLSGSRTPAALAKALETPAAKRTAAQSAELTKYFRNNVDSPVRAADQKLSAAKKAVTEYEADLPSTMVMKEIAQPRPAKLLIRGQYDKPGEAVTRAVPAFLGHLPDGAPNDRLGLAKWLVAPEHPLTARVWVNRAWEKFFGVGLVRTTENFGSQAEFPSHPELLDWLAAEFRQPTVLPAVNGQPARPWDMKAFQKMLVLSAAYQQAAAVTPAALKADPENRLLSRGPRFRLSAELVRDQALAISGLLVRKIGGPSVRPYMPDGVWDETSVYGDLRGYKADSGAGLYRRTLYTIWKRTAAPPSQLIFDAPNREICTVKRSRTNTPLQALALLNEITYVEAAKQLAQRMIQEGGTTPTERLTYGFRLATSHRPREAELKVLLAGYEQDLKKFQTDPPAAAKLLGIGHAKPDPQLPPAELAAFTLAANVLLNLDSVVTRE